MESNDKNPKPRKKRPSKNTEMEDFTVNQIKRLLKEALVDNLAENKKRSNMEIDAMVSTMEEFLRSFILIGYSMKNEPLVITHAKTQLDVDALYTSLSRLFFSMNNPHGLT